MKIPGLGDCPSTKVNCTEPGLCPNAPMGACLLLAYWYFSTRARKNKNHVDLDPDYAMDLIAIYLSLTLNKLENKIPPHLLMGRQQP